MTVIHNVKADILRKWLEIEEAVLIDVREIAEYQAESIVQARNLPLSQVTIDEAHLPEHRHKKLVIHCQSGKRSMMACEKLKNDEAPFDIWNLEGGIVAWKNMKLPIRSSDKKILPLDRQVQLATGTAIFFGTVLGNLLSPVFFVFPVIVGLGLINAGLTGWCGLAKLMAKMPWNQK